MSEKQTILNYLCDRHLSRSAQELVQFDMDSIRQVVLSEREELPNNWLVDPDGYERHGRVLRDSESSRMFAYAARGRALYATDGCNSCVQRLPKDLTLLSSLELHSLAEQKEIRLDLLEKLAAIVRDA